MRLTFQMGTPFEFEIVCVVRTNNISSRMLGGVQSFCSTQTAVHQEVLRLNVAMTDPKCMQVRKRPAHLVPFLDRVIRHRI